MKILIIKPSSFGDIIVANPVLTALKKNYPECAVKWLVFDEWKDVLRLFPLLDGVITWDKKKGLSGLLSVIKAVRKEQFDIVMDLQGLLRSAFVACFSGAKTKIGVPGMKEFSGILVKEPFPESAGINAVVRSLESFRFLTARNHEPEFKLAVTEDDAGKAEGILKFCGITGERKIIGIAPFVRGVSKQWPLEHFRMLTQLILNFKYDADILILGGKNDNWDFYDNRVVNLCGKTTIPELAGILKKCAVVAGGDTGIIQLAAAMNTPVVAIFGGSDINETAPTGPKTVLISKGFKCSPCRSRPTCRDFECLRQITPEEVMKAVVKWIN
ncbi:MAG: glycosyltransferase family 9 protein [Elusimicrobiota bacterium]